MKHVETTISETTIHVRYADHDDPTKAVEWMDARVKLDNAKMPSGTALKTFEEHRLAGLRLVALLHVRDTASAEIQRLSEIVNRRS